MILRGDICITNNIQDIEKCMFTHKIISIGELDKESMQNYKIVSGSLFIPPYQAAMFEIDGDSKGFERAYIEYLYGKECQEYIALIIRAIYEGKNILLYLSKDESEMMYSKILLKFFAEGFGLFISIDPIFSATFNEQYSHIICDLLYSLNLFSIEEYFLNFPIDKPITSYNIQKLVLEMNPYIQNRTIEGYLFYFNEYKNKIKNNNNRFFVNGIIYEEK